MGLNNVTITIERSPRVTASIAPGARGEQGERGPAGLDGEDGVVQTVVGADSVEVDDTDPANPAISLVGDEASPGNNKVYGTDGSGNRGWKDDPAEGGGLLTEYLGAVATKSRICRSFGSTNKQIMSRSRHFARDSIRSLQVVFPFWYVDGTTKAETAPGATADITASIEYPAGTFYQLLFSGGAEGTIANGGEITSDELSVLIPDGAEFWVRSFVESTAGIIASLRPDTAGGEAAAYAVSGLTDQTMTGSVTDGGASVIYRPVAIIGNTRKPAALLVGDSRVEGADDTADESSNLGLLERSLGARFGYINVANGGSTLANFIASHDKRVALGQYCSHVVINFGINDLIASDSAATVQARLETVISYFDQPTFVSTIEPVTTSSDSWATLANQTVAASNAARITVNGAIRAGVSGAAGYFEIADALESSRDSGKWKVTGSASGYTSDGIHGNQAAYRLLRALGPVNPTVLGEDRPRLATPEDVIARKGANLIVSPESLSRSIATAAEIRSGTDRLTTASGLASAGLWLRSGVLADDAVWTIDMGEPVFAGLLTLVANLPTVGSGIFRVRSATSSSGATVITSAGGTVGVYSNTVLTGTTGTDGQINIGASNANPGKIYIENRSGGVVAIVGQLLF